MSHSECRLNQPFLALQKKWYKLSKLGVGGGGGDQINLDKIQKNSNFFFVKPSLIASVLFYSSIASHPNSLQCSHNSLHLPINECLVPKKQILFFLTIIACNFYPDSLFIVLHQNTSIPQPCM